MRLVPAWVVWIVLVPALALGAPKKAAPKKAPKKAPATKPVDGEGEPRPTPDAADEPGKDGGKSPPAAGPAGGGGGGASAGSGAAGGAGDAKPDRDGAKDGAKGAGEPSGAADKPAGDDADVDTLRQEYLSLRDELFKSSARANAVASQLYSTRIQIRLTYTSGRYYTPVKSSIRLDGASVYENASGAIAGDDGPRFDGYVAPGRHLVTFRVEAAGKDDDTFGSVTEAQIIVKAVAGKDLAVSAKARDGGDIAYEWKRKERGSYGLAIDVAVKTSPRAEGGGGGAQGTKKGAKK